MPNKPPDPAQPSFQPTAEQINRLNRNLEVLSKDFEKYHSKGPAKPFAEEQLVEVNKSINKLGMALKSTATHIGHASASIGKFTAQSARDVGGKLHEQVYYDAKQHAARGGSAIGGLPGAVISKAFSESQTAQRLKLAAETKAKLLAQKAYASLKNALARQKKMQEDDTNLVLSTIGEKKASRRSNIKSEVSPSKTYQGSHDIVAAIDRLRVTNIALARQTATSAEADIRKQQIPKARRGGFVKKTGRAIVHAGEIIHPKTAVEKQVALLSDISNTQRELLAGIQSVQGALTDESAAPGGFFKSVSTTSQLLIPLFSGGMYKTDIQKSTNPFVTMSSALLEMYRWQRLYGELSKRQLNELIKLQGGEPQDVYGKRGVIFEVLIKNRKKILDKLGDYIADKESKSKDGKIGLKGRLAKGAKKIYGSSLVEMFIQDPDLTNMKFREESAKNAEEILSGKKKFSWLDFTMIKQRSAVANQKLVREQFPSQRRLESIEQVPSESEVFGRGEQIGILPLENIRAKRARKEELESKGELTDSEKEEIKIIAEEVNAAAAELWKKILPAEDIAYGPKAGRGGGFGGPDPLLENIDKNVERIRELIEARESSATKVNDFKAVKGAVTKIVTRVGDFIPSKDDMVTAFKSKKSKNKKSTPEQLAEISDTLKQTQNIQQSTLAVTQKEFDEAQKQNANIEKRAAEEKKAAEKEKKRQSVWDKMKGVVKNSTEWIKNTFKTILGSPILTGILAALIISLTSTTGAAIVSKLVGFIFDHPVISALLYLFRGTIFKNLLVPFVTKALPWLMKVGMPLLITQIQMMALNLKGLNFKSISTGASKLASSLTKISKTIITTVGTGMVSFGKSIVSIVSRMGGLVKSLGALAAVVGLVTAAFQAIHLLVNKEKRKEIKKEYEDLGSIANDTNASYWKRTKAMGKMGLKGVLNAPGAVYTVGSIISETNKNNDRADEVSREVDKWQKKKKTALKDVRSLKLKDKNDERDALRLFIKYPHENKFIKAMSSKGYTVTEIEKMITLGERRSAEKKEFDDAAKINKLIGIYGKDNVVPLYNQLKDANLVERLLKNTKSSKEKEEAKKYAQLIAQNPNKKDDIIACMKKGMSVEDAAKSVGVRGVEPLTESEKATNKRHQFDIKIAKSNLENHKKLVAELEKNKSKGKSIGSIGEKVLAESKEKVKSLESAVSAFETKIIKSPGDAQLDYTMPGQKKSSVINVSTLVPTRKVNDWTGAAKGILTKAGEFLEVHPNDRVEARKTQATNIYDDTVSDVKAAPTRFIDALTYAASNINVGDIADILTEKGGKERGKELVKQILRSSSDSAIDPIKWDIERAKSMPNEILREIENLPSEIKQTLEYRIQQGRNTTIGDIADEIKKQKESRAAQSNSSSDFVDVVDEIKKQKKTMVAQSNISSDIGDITEEIKKQREPRVAQSNINSDRAEQAKLIAVHEQMNDAAAIIKTSKKLGTSLEKSTASQIATNNTIVNNITKSSNSSIQNNQSGGGGVENIRLPLWRDIDSILSGNYV